MYDRSTLYSAMYMKMLMPANWNISYKDFVGIVRDSKSYAEVLQKCKNSNIQSIWTMHKIINQLQLSTEHFTPTDAQPAFPSFAEFVSHAGDLDDPDKLLDILSL